MKNDRQQHKMEKLLSMDVLEKDMDRRSFLQGTTKMAGLALGFSLVNPFSILQAEAASSTSASLSSAQGLEPDLVFPVISDVHIKKSGTIDIEKFRKALEQLNLLAPKQDAFAVVGDLTDYGLIEEYDRFMSLYNEKKQPEAVPLFTMGNHDYWNGLSDVDAQKRFQEKTGMESLYYHKVLKGYHFIIMGTETGTTHGYFSVDQINWLGQQLKQAKQDDPKKPIFVFLHQHITDTVYGSDAWGTKVNKELLYSTLKDYPQVITFSGHSHYPLEDPRSIHQKDFTSIGTSSVSYMELEKGKLQGNLPPGCRDISQGLIVEVYNNKVIIKRRDFHRNDWTGEPWEVSYPAEPNKFKYTETRDQKNPRFPKNASISVIQEKTTTTDLEIMFTQAADDSLVHSYKVVAKNLTTGEVAKEYVAFSEFYYDPVPNPLMLPIRGLNPDTSYNIEVIAIDSFGNIGENSLRIIGKTKALVTS